MYDISKEFNEQTPGNFKYCVWGLRLKFSLNKQYVKTYAK